ncbi:MAG: hypothetical protein IMZ50_12260 [Candidatus Atribacteria bacterium]|jgi:hypothetical protein|nr:hypothetical protein [Candidatus Atribacteria bacterium]
MESSNVLKDFASLPPDAQKQVLDFMAFLKIRYIKSESRTKPKNLRTLLRKTQSLPQAKGITEDEIVAEIAAYRAGQ